MSDKEMSLSFLKNYIKMLRTNRVQSEYEYKVNIKK